MRLASTLALAGLLSACATPFTMLESPRTAKQKFESCNLDETGPARKKCTALPVLVTAKVDAAGNVSCEARLGYDVALIYYEAKRPPEQGRISWSLQIDAPPGLEGRFEFVDDDGIFFKRGRGDTYDDPKVSKGGQEFSWRLVSTEAAALDHVAIVQYKHGSSKPVDCIRQDPVIINLPGSHSRR
jgi:hypothetical protein